MGAFGLESYSRTLHVLNRTWLKGRVGYIYPILAIRARRTPLRVGNTHTHSLRQRPAPERLGFKSPETAPSRPGARRKKYIVYRKRYIVIIDIKAWLHDFMAALRQDTRTSCKNTTPRAEFKPRLDPHRMNRSVGSVPQSKMMCTPSTSKDRHLSVIGVDILCGLFPTAPLGEIPIWVRCAYITIPFQSRYCAF